MDRKFMQTGTLITPARGMHHVTTTTKDPMAIRKQQAHEDDKSLENDNGPSEASDESNVEASTMGTKSN